MKLRTTERLRFAFGRAALVPMVAAATAIFSGTGHAQTSTMEDVKPNLTPCGQYNSAALDPRPVPEAIGGQAMIDAQVKAGFKTPATMEGAPTDLPATWYTDVKVTPEEAKQICEKHLSAVFIDWAGVPYNQAIDSGVKTVFDALGIKLLRIARFDITPSGLTGVLAAILPLKPDIIVTGGTLNPAQAGAILKPALDQGVTVAMWSVTSPKLEIGQDKPIKSLVTYDFYGLGLELADAVHQQYPNGANVGYIHWVNDVPPIFARESGFLDGLKKYPNIHIVTNGEPNPKNPASGYSVFNSPQAFTSAFLTAHPEVNLLFAPWEDPPGLGEAAAIKALHLEDKVKIVTMDFGEAGAHQIKHNGIIAVDMAQDVYDGGRMLALTAALATIGKDKYPFVFFPTFPVLSNTDTQAAWDFMHGPEVKCPESDCQ
jgi:ribose transport system substrate-binding protein